jgi:hypothetical protein
MSSGSTIVQHGGLVVVLLDMGAWLTEALHNLECSSSD